MISIVLALYNGSKYIIEQLESIRLQTVKADEVIICDDCSTDNSVALCRDFIKRNALLGWSVIENNENVGYCRNFYRALSRSHGDYIFFCDQDDVWDTGKIEVMVRFLEKNKRFLGLACNYRLINAKGQEDPSLSAPHHIPRFDGTLDEITPERLIGHSYIRGCALCIRKEIKELVRPIELKDLLGHDWQVVMLCALKGKAAILNTALMSYRCHDNNASFSLTPSRLIQKRISGLTQSIEGHSYILSHCTNATLKEGITNFIKFEKKRLKFLHTGNPLTFISLAFYLKEYRRYYHKDALRVYLGDLVYKIKKQ